MSERLRRKNPPKNRMKCCVGGCHGNTALFYLQHYPICDKHWDLDCDDKFKYKHFRTLREFLGFPPIKKPEGFEHLDRDCFAYHAQIQIDVETNSPVVMSEELTIWSPDAPPQQPEQNIVKWNGKKEDPLELYVAVGKTKVVLLRATGKAVKFSSEKAIKSAMDKIQGALDAGISGIDLRIQKAFKKSRFWEVTENCQEQIEAARGN